MQVPEEVQCKRWSMISLWDARTDDAGRVIVLYLVGLLIPGRTDTETMLQATESLIDIFADERAPAKANFRAGNVLEAFVGAVESVP
jgi:hypothetical protein